MQEQLAGRVLTVLQAMQAKQTVRIVQFRRVQAQASCHV